MIDLPERWSAAHLYYQTVHGRPIFGGMLEGNARFTPAELTQLREENGLWSALEAATPPGPPPPGAPEANVTPQDNAQLGPRC